MVRRSTATKTPKPVSRERSGHALSERLVKTTPLRTSTGAPPLRGRAWGPTQVWVPPGLAEAPALDLMCAQFVLTLAARLGPRFNLRRDLNTLLALTGRHLVWPLTVLQRLRGFLERRCRDDDLWQGQATLTNAAFMERFGAWHGPYEEGTLYFHLDEYAKEAPKDMLSLLAATVHWLGRSLVHQQTVVEHNISELAELLLLNRAERAVLLYGTLARYQRDLRSMLVEFKVNNAPEAYAMVAEVAGVDAGELAEALRVGSRLERIGLVDNLMSEHHITDLADLMKVSERLPPVLMRPYRDRNELMAVFTRPAARSTLTLAHFDFVREDADLLCALLKGAVARQESGINILVYGPPGTGKTELTRVAAQAAGLELFEVEYADREGHSLSGRDRYRSLQIAQVFLKSTARSALLFDEVEDVFPTVSSDMAQRLSRAEQVTGLGSPGVGGKAWVNQMLETNPVPTVWITNRIEQIDPAFRRRFTFHLELKSPPPGAREQLLRHTLANQPVSDALVARLAERPGLTPAQIRTAMRFARLVDPAVAEGVTAPPWDQLIEHQLRHADQALGRRNGAALRPQPLQYGLEWLNLETRHEIPRLLQALRARGHGTLCLHGLPGTGKTALAEHLARELERPLMVRQASDLLGKFVGETEQQMATMFAEATAEQAVLLLDEADSFLLDRQSAHRQHEVSEVNEMLQGMERFPGVFVCTTNLLDRIDAAALRRFTFKIRFLPLRPDQRVALFAVEAMPQGGTPPPDLEPRLAKLHLLCLGDFAAVKRQFDILQEPLDPLAFLEQLEAEHRLKPEVRDQRQMGFLN